MSVEFIQKVMPLQKKVPEMAKIIVYGGSTRTPINTGGAMPF